MSKVYMAEDVTFSGKNGDRQLGSLAEVQEYANEVLSSAFVQSRWGQVKVTFQRGRGQGANSWGGVVTIGVPAQRTTLVLHELAHELLRHLRGPAIAGHGPEFTATLLTLIDHFVGPDAAGLLRAQFTQRKVKYRTGMQAVPKAGTRKVISKAVIRDPDAERRRKALASPLTQAEQRQAALLLRRAIANGAFGPPGRKPRAHAQATARILEGSTP